MALDESVEALEALEAIFGQAQGQLERSSSTNSSSSVPSEFLPFLFSLAPKDPRHLRLCVSDFHSQTWQSNFSVSQLVELRDEVGIAGSLHDFLTYLRTALSSSDVKFILGRQPDASGDATTGRVVAQKTRGTPLISLALRKLDGSAADDAKASIAFRNFQGFTALSSALSSEKARVVGLEAVLSAEKAKTEKLQEQISASRVTFASRNKLNRTLSPLFACVSQQPSLPSTQLDTQLVLPSLPAIVSGISKDGEEVAAPKARGNNSRVHVAPTSRRVKRRGTVIRERIDE